MADPKKTKPKAKRATTRKPGTTATRGRPKGKTSPVKAKTTGKAKPASKAGTTKPAKASSAGKKPEKSAAGPGRAAKDGARSAARSASARGPFASRPTHKKFGTAGTQSANAGASAASRVSGLGEQINIHDLTNKLWRLIAMVAFGFIGFWVYMAITILAAIQFFVVLFADKPSNEIERFMGLGAAYVAQVLDLLSYHSEDLPYPLGPPPEVKS